MTSDGTENGGDGVTSTRVTVLTLTYNHETCQVTIGGSPMPVSLAQMIIGEGMRLLDEQRRIAAAQELRARLEEQKRTQELVNSIAGRR